MKLYLNGILKIIIYQMDKTLRDIKIVHHGRIESMTLGPSLQCEGNDWVIM